jgi:hypothetical protein
MSTGGPKQARLPSPRPEPKRLVGSTVGATRDHCGARTCRGRFGALGRRRAGGGRERAAIGLARATERIRSIPTGTFSMSSTAPSGSSAAQAIRKARAEARATLVLFRTRTGNPLLTIRATKRDARANAGRANQRNPGSPRHPLRASERTRTRVPGLVFPQCSLRIWLCTVKGEDARSPRGTDI